MRRDASKRVPLPARLHHQSQRALFEIAKSAMYQLRGTAGSAAGEIRLVDQRNAQPAERRISSYSRPEDPAPDDHYIESLAAQCREMTSHLEVGRITESTPSLALNERTISDSRRMPAHVSQPAPTAQLMTFHRTSYSGSSHQVHAAWDIMNSRAVVSRDAWRRCP